MVNYAWITAAAASVGIFWNQIKNMYIQAKSFVIVTIDLDSGHGHTDPIVALYLWENFKMSRFGPRKYTTRTVYSPRERFWLCQPHEIINGGVYYKGRRPLFVTKSGKDGERSVKLSFLRGTFKEEELLIDMHNLFNERKRTRLSRYEVRNISASKSDGGQIEEMSNEELRPLTGTRDTISSESKKLTNPPALSKNQQDLLDLLVMWSKSREWFAERKLPWRMGAGLIGNPGTGKSSFISMVAKHLDLPLFSFDISGMDNTDLNFWWNNQTSNAPCIILFEDFDRVFDKSTNLNKGTMEKQPVTFDAILNCISGIHHSDGVLTFITANDTSKLSPPFRNVQISAVPFLGFALTLFTLKILSLTVQTPFLRANSQVRLATTSVRSIVGSSRISVVAVSTLE